MEKKAPYNEFSRMTSKQRLVQFVLLLVFVVVLGSCGDSQTAKDEVDTTVDRGVPLLRDITAQSGVDFVTTSGAVSVKWNIKE